MSILLEDEFALFVIVLVLSSTSVLASLVCSVRDNCKITWGGTTSAYLSLILRHIECVFSRLSIWFYENANRFDARIETEKYVVVEKVFQDEMVGNQILGDRGEGQKLRPHPWHNTSTLR